MGYKDSARRLVGLAALAAAWLLLERYDPKFPASMKEAWGKVVDMCEHDTLMVFVVATNAWGMLVYWGVGALFVALNFTSNSWAERYRVQPTKNVPVVDAAKFRSAVRQVVFNQVVVGPLLALALLPIVKWRRMGIEVNDGFPSVKHFARDLVGYVIVEEIGFYYAHRLFHEVPWLYKMFHKRHHEWTAPIAIAARYAHPVEDVLANVGPVFAGPLVMGSHFVSVWIWLVIALTSTLIGHSGFHFPGLPSPEFHDFHHLVFNANYGATGWLDALHGTNAKFHGTAQERRHHTLLSLQSAREEIPDKED